MKWKRTIGRTLAGLLALLLIAVLTGYCYLRSSSFQRFALRKIVEQSDLATGGRAEIGAVKFDWPTLTGHLYNITLHGREDREQTPLLHADELTVRLKIPSVLHLQVGLRELVLAHPVIHLRVSRQGQSNLPSVPSRQSGSRTRVFDLAIDHAQLTNGEINYNDKKIPVDANLYDLGTNVYFEHFAKRYEGTLSYNHGRVRYAQYTALPHSLALKFSASPERFNVETATLKLGASEVTFDGQISNDSNPIADGSYKIRIHSQDFASMSPAAAPAGDVLLSGKLHYQSVGSQSFLKNASLNGHLASDVITASASGTRIEMRKLEGTYALNNGNLRVSDLRAEAFGGRIAGGIEVNHLDETPESRIQASLHSVSLRSIQQAFRSHPLQAVAFSGTVGGTIEASWKGNASNLRARSDLVVQALAGNKSHPAGTEVPVDGAIHVTYDGVNQTIGLSQTALRTPAITLMAQGKIGDRSRRDRFRNDRFSEDHSVLQVQLAAKDLHQLLAVISFFRPTQTGMPVVSGSATLNAVVHGSLGKPIFTALLNAQNLEVQGSEWTSARVDVRANSSEVAVQNGMLVDAHGGQANFSGSVKLTDWSYEPSNPIKAGLDLKRMRVVDLQKLANRQYPISGDLSAKLSLEGSQNNPEGSGSAQLANAHVYGEPIQNLAANFRAANGSIVSTLNLATAAGALDANLSYTPKTKAYTIRMKVPSVVLQKLRVVQMKNLPLNGTVTASVTGEGTLDDPRLVASVELPRLQIRDNSIFELKAEIRVASHDADFNLESEVSQASIHAHGRVALSGDYYTEAVIDSGSIPLGALMATYAPTASQGFQGQTELHATFKGPLKDRSKIEAHVSIPVLKASYQSLQIGIANPIQADYVNSVITLQPAEIQGTGTWLRVQGRVPIGGTGSPTLSAKGSVDVRILRIVAPRVESSGMLDLDLHVSGSAAKSKIEGQVRLKDVAMITADSPVGVEKLNGTFDIRDDRVQISKMAGQIGGGQVSVGGSIAYRPSVQFNVAMQGQSVRLRYPDGLRSVLDANLMFSGTTQDSTLNGRVLIDSLSFTPDFDLAKFSDHFSTGNSLSQPGVADNVRLAIGVQSRENLNATSSQISIAGQAALQVGGTAANPVITGRTILSSGEVFYRNVRYHLQTGVITFDDPNETHPVMNISASTTVEQYNLTLTLRGPLDKLTTSYVSDPPLATADIINLIAQGKTTQEANATSQSTDSIIASQAASQVSGGVEKLAGISSLQIDPLMSGNNQNPSAQVAIQQRVTKNLLFTFTTDVSQPGSEMVQGEYQINKRWSVSTTRDQLGGVSVDGRYHTRF